MMKDTVLCSAQWNYKMTNLEMCQKKSFSKAPQGKSRAGENGNLLANFCFRPQPKRSAGCGYMAPALRAQAHKVKYDKQRKMHKKIEKKEKNACFLDASIV